MTRIAVIVSFLGHPLLTMSAFLLYAGYSGGVISLAQSGIVIGLLIVPLALWNLRQTRAGSYSNFDVSVRTERRSMYFVMLGLLTITFIVLSISSKAFRLRVGLGSVLVMLASAALINRHIKISLHTTFSFYIAMAFTSMDGRIAAGVFALATVVALSRLVLLRHTLVEIALGALLGIGTGACQIAISRLPAPPIL